MATDVSPSSFAHTQPVGSTCRLPQPDLVAYFGHLFDDEVLHLLVVETNR